MKFRLDIDMSNAAFGETEREMVEELAKIIDEVADDLRYFGDRTEVVCDTNGNTVGRWTIYDGEEDHA